jgi:uncharacterized protein YukE
VDGNWVRRCAGEVGELSEQVRGVAAALGGVRAESWRSLAADEFRETLAEQQRAVADLAGALDEARAALEVHARAVDDAGAGPLAALAGRASELLGLHP